MFRWRHLLVAVALVAGYLVSVPLPAQAADPCAPPTNPIACENSKPGTDPYVWDIDGAGDSTIQGFATDASVNVGASISFKVKTSQNYTITIFRLGYYRDSAPGRSPQWLLPPAPAGLPGGRATDLLRLRQLGGVGDLGRCLRRPCPGCTSPTAPHRHGRREPYPLRGPRRQQPFRHRHADVGHHLAGLQHLRRLQLLPGTVPTAAPTSSATTARTPRAGSSTSATGSCERVPDHPLPRGERLRRQLQSGVDTDRRGVADPEPQDVPVRRTRRVLVRRGSATTSRRPATPASTSPSSAATRSTGGPDGSRPSTARHRPPDPRLLQGDRDNAKIDPSSQWTGPGATPASPARRGRRRPRERPDRHPVHGQRH